MRKKKERLNCQLPDERELSFLLITLSTAPSIDTCPGTSSNIQILVQRV